MIANRVANKRLERELKNLGDFNQGPSLKTVSTGGKKGVAAALEAEGHWSLVETTDPAVYTPRVDAEISFQVRIYCTDRKGG